MLNIAKLINLDKPFILASQSLMDLIFKWLKKTIKQNFSL